MLNLGCGVGMQDTNCLKCSVAKLDLVRCNFGLEFPCLGEDYFTILTEVQISLRHGRGYGFDLYM
jgi:hypothetical protein